MLVDQPRIRSYYMQISRVIRSFASTSCQRIHIARYTTSGPPGPKFNLEEWEQLTDEANPPELDESYKRHSSQRAQGVIDETVKSFVDSAARRTLERNGELNSEADPDALEAFSVESNPPEVRNCVPLQFSWNAAFLQFNCE